MTEPQPATKPTTMTRLWWIKSGIAGLLVALGLSAAGFYYWHSPAAVAARREPRWPGTDPAVRTPDKLRVLFIGNSFTQYNSGLANVMTQLAASAGKTPAPVFDQYTVWGATWERLWKNSDASAAIAEGRWDFVVLQDYSIAALIYRDEMDEYGQVFSKAIRKAGAEPVFFMTWARGGEAPTQKTITGAYIAVGRQNDAGVAPVGLAFARVQAERPGLTLVNTIDKKHPTPAGSYLAGCVFFAVFYHQSPAGLTPRITDGTKAAIDLAPADAAYLQQAAWQTVLDFKSQQATTKPTGGK